MTEFNLKENHLFCRKVNVGKNGEAYLVPVQEIDYMSKNRIMSPVGDFKIQKDSVYWRGLNQAKRLSREEFEGFVGQLVAMAHHSRELYSSRAPGLGVPCRRGECEGKYNLEKVPDVFFPFYEEFYSCTECSDKHPVWSDEEKSGMRRSDPNKDTRWLKVLERSIAND